MEFLFAVARNDVEKVRSMLQSGIDVNSSFIWNSKDTYSPVIPSDIIHRPDLLSNLQTDQKYQCKPLNIAVLGGHPNMVRLLLSAGADINNKDGRGRTALVCAIYGLDLDASNINTSNLHLISQTNASHFDIMKNILLCHPNLYYATLDAPQYEIKGITPLCLASYLGKADIIQLLLEDGRVNVDGTDSKNATALMYAARDGNVPIVKMLLGYHASPDITDSHGWSAIQYAERNPEIVQLCEEVLRMKRSELVTSNNCTVNYPINYSKLSHLLCTIPNYPSSLSHLQFDTLKEIDHLDPSAAPLVHIIQSAFLQAIKIHDHLSLQTLLMKSPPLNGIQRCGPLLINHHDPKTGLTAFHHAMRTKPLPSLDTITMLFQAGADMNSQTYYGRTALHHLARFGIDKDGQSWGIQKSSGSSSNGKGASAEQQPPAQPMPPPTPPLVSSTSTGVHIPEHLAMCASLLIRFGSLVNIADPTGNTPLHFAAEFGGVPEVLEVLILEGGADLSLKNKKGLTPLDVCKSDDIKRRMLQLESERKHANKTKSVISSLSGTIRPFDSASEYNRASSVARSTTIAPASAVKIKSMISKVSASFVFCGDEDSTSSRLPMSKQKQLLIATIQRKKDDASYDEYSDFEVILKAFFSYQTTFTDSIESSLAYITDSILGSWNMAQHEHVSAIQQLDKTITQLRFELREAHEMFDSTDQLVEKVMMSFREELEQVEQVHQADWEMSELQHDKIEKLFDVFERIDGRFCQLELAQDDLIGQIERLRKAAARKQQQLKMQEQQPSVDISDCVVHLSQSLLILQTVPIDQVLYLRDDRNRLYQDMTVVVDQVVQEIEVHLEKNTHDDQHSRLTQAKVLVQERWSHVKEVLTKTYHASADKEDEPLAQQQQQSHQLTRSISQPTTVRQKHAIMYKKGGGEHPSLNQLELSFDILHSNLYEIQKDIEEVTEHLEKLMLSKKKMYELCLSLEKELNDPERTRAEDEIKSELSQVLVFTQQLFDKQHALDKERTQLLTEYAEIEQQLDATRDSLHKVRPPALLQGLLDRLDTEETPCVRVEKDWKEDSNLVTEIVVDPQPEDDESCASSATSTSNQQQEMQLTALQSKQLSVQCASKLSTLCYIARLDASLYCLKVLASHAISKSRQHLLQVQASLGQASTDLDETRNQMTQLYDDAAEVARQVFALKTELETIVRHRKEEVVKVWEVVDEVSEGVDAKAIQCQQQQQSQKQAKSQQKVPLQVVADQGGQQHKHKQQQQERIEEQDRHQWIIRELEQLQHVHESLQDAIDELKQEQAMIGQSLRQLASVFIEPQVDKLVGQDETSLLSVSDRLAELMDRVRDNDIGLRPSSMSAIQQQATQKSQEAAAVPVKSNTTGVGPRIHPANKNNTATTINRLSRLSAATNRLSASTYNSNRSSYYVRSPSSVVLDNNSNNKRLSAAMSIRTDKKRMSIISATSLSSLSSYQQERMMARASNLSSALSKVQQQKNTSTGNKQITSRK
ncbi:hypothetical protein MBANPS3_011015 [Mucor bainieri]